MTQTFTVSSRMIALSMHREVHVHLGSSSPVLRMPAIGRPNLVSATEVEPSTTPPHHDLTTGSMGQNISVVQTHPLRASLILKYIPNICRFRGWTPPTTPLWTPQPLKRLMLLMDARTRILPRASIITLQCIPKWHPSSPLPSTIKRLAPLPCHVAGRPSLASFISIGFIRVRTPKPGFFNAPSTLDSVRTPSSLSLDAIDTRLSRSLAAVSTRGAGLPRGRLLHLEVSSEVTRPFLNSASYPREIHLSAFCRHYTNSCRPEIDYFVRIGPRIFSPPLRCFLMGRLTRNLLVSGWGVENSIDPPEGEDRERRGGQKPEPRESFHLRQWKPLPSSTPLTQTTSQSHEHLPRPILRLGSHLTTSSTKEQGKRRFKLWV